MALDPIRSAQFNRLLVEAQDMRLAETEAVAVAAAADAAAAQGDADTGIADAATAQSTANTALALAENVEVTTEALAAVDSGVAAAAGRAVAPLYNLAGAGLHVSWYVPGPSDLIKYRVNGGAWTTYTTTVVLTLGDTIEAYNQKSGLTDSLITTYDT
jgi:hypothetical protein